MVKITGASVVTNRLKTLAGPNTTRLLGQALFAGAESIAVEAQISMTRGSVSGKAHVPSRPGEPPRADTHHLADSIEISGSGAGTDQLRAEVSAFAEYAAFLEFGTSRVLPRPFMKPAAKKMRPKVKALIERAIEAAARS